MPLLVGQPLEYLAFAPQEVPQLGLYLVYDPEYRVLTVSHDRSADRSDWRFMRDVDEALLETMPAFARMENSAVNGPIGQAAGQPVSSTTG